MTSNEQHPGVDQPLEPVGPNDDALGDLEETTEESDPVPSSPTHLADDELDVTASPDTPASADEPLPPRALQALPPEPEGPDAPQAPAFPAPVQPVDPTPGFQPGQAFPPPPYANSGNTAANQPPTTFPAPSQVYPPPPPEPAYPFAPPPPPKKSNKTQLLIGAGVLVLILAVVTGWTLLGGAGGVGINIPGQNSTAKAAVQSYLEALAAGNATAAIELAEVVPADRSMLTDEALKASLQRAPITAIAVNEASGSDVAIVTASYRLGNTPVTARFETKKVGASWRLTRIASELPLDGIDGVPVAVNGIAANSSGRLTLFPGSYALTSVNDRVTITGGEFALSSPTDSIAPSFSLTISPQGLEAARSVAQDLLVTCVKQAQLAPPGCGFGVRANGVKVKKIAWRITSGKDSLSQANFQVTPSNPFVATVKPYIQLAVTVYDTAGRRYTGADAITTVKADLSGPDVVVTFNS